MRESLEMLDPLFEMTDSVFIELSKNQDKMKKSIQNSFMLAYFESTFMDVLRHKEGAGLEKSLEVLSGFSNSSFVSLPKLILNTTKTISDSHIFNVEDGSYSEILYSLTAAKRKIEREIDWTICSFDKSTLPLIRQSEVQINDSINQDYTLTTFHPNLVTLTDHINNKLKISSNSKEWNNKQSLSLLLKNSSKRSDTFYLDTKSVPDANDLNKVLDIPLYCKNEKLTSKTLAKIMKVRPRMALYYLDAAEMLGLIKKTSDYYTPTDLVDKLGRYSDSDRASIINNLIKELPVVKAFFLYLKSNSKTRFTTNDITKFLEYSTDLSPSTARRRASTISSWLKVQKIVKNRNESFYIEDEISQTKLNEFLNS